MALIRRKHDASFKVRVGLEAVRGEKTVARISSDYKVHGNQFRQKKKKLLQGLQGIFTDGRKKADKENEKLTAELWRQIGQQKVELDWLKNLHYSADKKRSMIEPGSGIH